MMNHAHLDYIPLKVNSNMVQHPGEKGPAHLTHKLQTHLRKNTSSSNSSAIMYVYFLSGFTSLYATVGQQASHLSGSSEVLYNCSCKGCQEFFLLSLLSPQSLDNAETLGDGAVHGQELDDPCGIIRLFCNLSHRTLHTTGASRLVEAHILLHRATMGSSYLLQQIFKIKIPGNIRDCTAFGNGLVLCVHTLLEIR